MSSTVSVVLVGCGCPLKSMGWYHAEQIVTNRCPSATLKYIVEPFYMNAPATGDRTDYNAFQTWKIDCESKYGIQFLDTVDQVPSPDANEIRMGIISARTSDNPKLFSECIAIGCQVIFLEKPGAPSVGELVEMKELADTKKVQVYMGFNKNVSSYVAKTLQYVTDSNASCDVTFLHNNAYADTDVELAECFERNSEGMLKNMAIHELAILVTYYNVTIDEIASVQADATFSKCTSYVGPSSGATFTDFTKLKFKITTKSGTEVCVAADRCGGDDSVGIVTVAGGTEEVLARYTMPDEDTVAAIPALESKYPGARPYFFTQDPDYAELKERVAKAMVDGTEPVGVATIDTAIQALKLAEYLTPILQEQLLSPK